MKLTPLRTLVTPAALALIVMATIAYAQLPNPGPHIPGPVDGRGGTRGGPRPCSSLLGPGSCSPGPSIDVTRYIPPPLDASSAGLRLQIRPATAAVYVDGRYAGRVDEFDGDSERLVLTPGSHSVNVRASGYEPLEIETRTRAGQTTVYHGTMSPVAASRKETAQVFAPIDVQVPFPPRPLVAGGATHLVYELHVTNMSSRRTTLEAVDVMDRSASPDAPPLLHLEGEALDEALRLLAAPPDQAEKRILPGGGTAIVFVWVTLRAGTVPAVLTHRFALEPAASDGATLPSGRPTRATEDPAVVVRGVEVAVSTNEPRVIGAPLEGDHWLAANGPDNGSDHRRALLALSGEGRIAQRFAIDWVRLFEDGRTFRGDPRNNDSYRAFGAKVLAVADGVVLDTLDGLPENVPDPVARAVPITPATVSGNYILLDIGDAAYAVYAHLQPGSLRVRQGDRVRRGQVLALVGNTGNSSEPHLHFHITDRPNAINAEGIPYAFAAFALEAEPQVVTPALRPLGGSLEIGPSGLAAWKTGALQRRVNEIPLLNAIVAFLNVA